MKIFRFADLIAMPWKNGGGVTRELLCCDRDGQTLWRLSIADVSAEGPFSMFPGMRRILTVIEGQGMRLSRPDGSFIAADLLSPVAFNGEEPIGGELPYGPCRDFNVIWNPDRCDAAVEVIEKGAALVAPDDGKSLLVAVESSTLLPEGGKLEFGDWIPLAAEKLVSIVAGKCLLVTIREYSHP